MLSEESTRVLRDLALRAGPSRAIEETFRLSAQTVAECALEHPFFLFYCVDPRAKRARLVGCAGLPAPDLPPAFLKVQCASFPKPLYLDRDGWQELHACRQPGDAAGLGDPGIDSAMEELEQRLRELTQLCEIGETLCALPERQAILEETLRSALLRENADMGLLSLCDPDEKRMEIAASAGFEKHALDVVRDLAWGTRVCGAAFRERARVVVEDLEADSRFAPYAGAARLAGFRAVHSTPLITPAGKLVGVLSTHFRGTHRPSASATRLADRCARQAASFIEHAASRGHMQESSRRKDEFLATLAHELRNPLASLSNALHMLGVTGGATRAEPAYSMMERQIHHMARLVDDLLELSRITRGKMELRRERMELAAIVRSAVETVKPRIEEARHRLTLSLPPDPVMLEVDPVRIAQVIANLLDNAAKYTDEGGAIGLGATLGPEEVSISVRDSGVGIRPELLPRIFDMFAQGDRAPSRAHEGLGIGLGLVKSIVQLHGGRVEARSEGLGRGSEFVVRLPLRAAASEDLEVPPREPADGQLGPVRILVVDDNRDAADSLSELLGLRGARVRAVYSGGSALQAIHAYRPAIVLLDLGMPGMDGYEVARRLRRDPSHAATVLIALTGRGQHEDRRRSKAAGFDYHLVKPVDISGLLGLLGSISAA